MTRPGVGWELHEQPGGRVDLRLDGRIVQHDLEDAEEALRAARRHRRWAGQPVTLVDQTGYREQL